MTIKFKIYSFKDKLSLINYFEILFDCNKIKNIIKE
jgi:hypothetical protein